MRFLHVLAEHPWRERPLVIDPEASMAPEARASAEAAYGKVPSCDDSRRNSILHYLSLFIVFGFVSAIK